MSYTVLTHKPTPASDVHQLCIDVLVGLSERPKRLPSRLFYDDEGSRLFQRITSLGVRVAITVLLGSASLAYHCGSRAAMVVALM